MRRRGQASPGIIIALAVLISGLLYGIYTYNSLVRLHEAIPAAWSQVDNVLQRRNDLIPNLVNTVKGYAKHESQVFEDIAHARSALSGAFTLEQKVQANNQMTGALSRLLAIAENYPTLKADQNFLALQDELAGTENRIAVERMRYNQVVQDYNTRVQSFPSNVIARAAGFTPMVAYFRAPEAAHQVPEVKF